jgi:hypothetical protein
MTGDEADKIEQSEAMRSLAGSSRAMYNAFLAEGFTEQQALKLVQSRLAAVAGAASE